MKTILSFSLIALQLLLVTGANATGEENRLQKCLLIQGKVPPEKALECYNQAAQEQLAKSEAEKQDKPFVKTQSRGLAEEWAPAYSPLSVYKQNYLLFYSYSSHPNDTPGTPSQPNQALTSYPWDNRDMKFQISLKAHLLGLDRYTLWFGYTQLSFWQFYDTAHSTPIRENNYEPEIIYSYRPENLQLGSEVAASFLNAGLMHQSNGEPMPGSRGWSGYYIQAGLERDFGDNGRLALIPRLWKRLSVGDPDIANYIGIGDISLRYSNGQGVYALLVKARSLQIDLGIPVSKLFGARLLNTNIALQYFNGYGESLTDYNQSHRTYGVGLSLPI